jgi:hypothetical protein
MSGRGGNHEYYQLNIGSFSHGVCLPARGRYLGPVGSSGVPQGAAFRIWRLPLSASGLLRLHLGLRVRWPCGRPCLRTGIPLGSSRRRRRQGGNRVCFLRGVWRFLVSHTEGPSQAHCSGRRVRNIRTMSCSNSTISPVNPLQDVRTATGILVSTHGFQKSAETASSPVLLP